MTHRTQTHQAVGACAECMPDGSSWMLSIPIYVNGDGPFAATVDTGAGVTVILPELAAQLGLKAIDTEERRGVGGSVIIDVVGVDAVQAGDIKVELDQLGVSDVMKRLSGTQFMANLGYDIMHHGRLVADFANSSIRLEASDPNRQDGTPFKIASAKKPLVVVQTLVNGSGPYRFAVDTGAMGTCIAPALANELGLKRGDAIQAAGVGGRMDAHFAADPVTVRVGTDCAQAVTPVVLDIFNGLAPETGTALSGIIGRDIMKHYLVTIDYPQFLIRFK